MLSSFSLCCIFFIYFYPWLLPPPGKCCSYPGSVWSIFQSEAERKIGNIPPLYFVPGSTRDFSQRREREKCRFFEYFCLVPVLFIILFYNSTPEMEVTEIILAKVSRLCQLSSHSRGILSRLWIFKSIGLSIRISLACKTRSYYTKNASGGCLW